MDLEAMFDSHSKRKKTNSLNKIVKQINIEFFQYQMFLTGKSSKQAEEFFHNATDRLRKEAEAYIRTGYDEEDALKRILPKAYGLVKLATEYRLKKAHYDVQLMGGILLNDGYVSEMATGEGKTITAALPTYLNALLGKGAHVITPNAYLARRDFEEMRQVYELLGLSCGLVEEINPTRNKAKAKRLANEIYLELLRTPRARGRSLNQLKSIARKRAFEQVREEDIKARREAYRCDVTYGSSNAFAFDYLFDWLEPNPDLIRGRAEKPNFLVIDEADAVLFDDAVTPFTLSGKQTDKTVAISEVVKSSRERSITLASNALDLIFREDERLKKYFRHRTKRSKTSDGLIFRISDPMKYDALVSGKIVDGERFSSTQAIYFCEKTKQFSLTPVGEACMFLSYKKDEIQALLNANKDKILALKHEGEPIFKAGLDYYSAGEDFVLTPRAFSYLAESNIIPELTEMFDDFMLTEFQESYEDIQNAMTAWLVLQNGVDYKYSIPSDSIDREHERSISLIMNGRTAEGRVYSNGLQQAVEAKERIKNKNTDIVIRASKIKDTLASIPAASFFGRYQKFSGMTGTSAVRAFKELYGLDTFTVPRNKPRNVNDHGDRLYKTTEEKNKAILAEVIKSHQKGQPILLTTTSVEESEKLHAFLVRELAKKGINVNIPVLNANVENLREEAKIIAQAGVKGAITISTEMAGRGTDIKLGGIEPPSIEQEIKNEETRRLLETTRILKEQGREVDDTVLHTIRKMHEKYHDEIVEIAKKKYKKNIDARNRAEREIIALGGLKVIGSGHFSYTRVDNQVKGRCGRQGNAGEVVFFNDIEDLIRIGVSPKDIKRFSAALEKGPIVEEHTKRTPLGDLIYSAQAKNEERTKESIHFTQKVEGTVAKCRSHLRETTEGIKRENDYRNEVIYMIEKVVDEIVITSSKTVQNHNDLKGDMKLSRLKLDNEQLISLADEFLGQTITESDIESCETVLDLVNILIEEPLMRFETAFDTGGEEYLKSTKAIVDKRLNRTWFAFEDVIERIKNQYALMGLIPGNNPPETVEPALLDGYFHCYESMTAQIVRQILNPKYLEKHPEDHMGLSEFVVNTDVTTERITTTEAEKRNEETRRMIDEEVETARVDRKKSRSENISRVNLPYFVSVVKERLHLTRDSRELGRSHSDDVTHRR